MPDPQQTADAPPAEQQAQGDAQPQDSAAIRQMRAEIERAQAEAREAKEQAKLLNTKLTERQRAEMSEQERMRSELEEMRQMAAQGDLARDELGRWQSWAQSDYNAELAKVDDPGDRATLQGLSQVGDWRERLEALRNAKVMYGKLNTARREAEKAREDLAKAQAQSQYGTRTQPAARPPTAPQPAPTERQKFNKAAVPSWDSVLKPVVRPGRQTDTTET